MAYVKDSEKFLIGCHDLYTEIDPLNTYMVIYKWNRKNFTTEFSVYPYTYDKTKPKYILRPVYTGEVLPELIKELIDLAFSYVREFNELKTK